jgi:GTP-binding protein
MIFDEVKIFVRSGDGGNGAATFRREKFVPRGGPSGGDGGRGGDVVLVVNPKLSTLADFYHGVHFKARNGERGGSANKTGASSDAVEVAVPPGTIVKDAETGAILADLVAPDARFTVVTGGRGGRGNQHFATPANQTPRYAEKGEPGQEKWLVLELRMIADVGIVGLPNAGKSTLLSVVSNAKPKIAAYPFTTLQPNLGVVTYDDRSLVFADIPGLIEGAHLGVGLGHSFLRHVQRTRVLIHMVDATAPDPLADYSQITSELALYDERLSTKPQLVVLSKLDLPEAQERQEALEAAFKKRGIKVMAISAATQLNVQSLVQSVFRLIDTLPEEAHVPIVETPLYELPEAEIPFTIQRDTDGAYHVRGRRIERAAAMTYWDNEEAVLRFQELLATLGISSALQKTGVKPGDTVFIGDYELEWSE